MRPKSRKTRIHPSESEEHDTEDSSEQFPQRMNIVSRFMKTTKARSERRKELDNVLLEDRSHTSSSPVKKKHSSPEATRERRASRWGNTVDLDAVAAAGVESKWKDFNPRKRDPSGRFRNMHDNLHPKNAHLEKKRFHDILNKTIVGIYREIDAEIDIEKYEIKKCSKASNHALITYFAKLSQDATDIDVLLDYDFIENLIENGADPNISDKYGQTVMHEAARAWTTDAAQFLILKGAYVDPVDKYGRSPLHVAAAVNYTEMVDFLIKKGASVKSETYGELQTPVHYAAKNDAVDTLKLLIEHNGDIEARDYKERTPLQVAAELDRSLTASLLIQEGALIGVKDYCGLPAMALMVQNMCPIAKKALRRLHVLNGPNRQQSYFLNLLEPKITHPSARTPMRIAVKQQEIDLLTIPAFRRLLEVKWEKFGRKRHNFQLLLYLFYILLWTAIGVTLPVPDPHKNHDEIDPQLMKDYRIWWRLLLEGVAQLLTLIYILESIQEIYRHVYSFKRYKTWRIDELNQDLKYTHPQWPDERTYLQMEIDTIRNEKERFFTDMWNVFDWLSYILTLSVVGTRVITFINPTRHHALYHRRLLAVCIFFIWLRLMKLVRVFSALGPFIVMLGHIIDETLKFGFLFCEIFVPFVIAFWMLFGGELNAQLMDNMLEDDGESSHGWKKLNNLIYSVWQMFHGGDFTVTGIMAISEIWAQILVGIYTAISTILMLNLFIALMSNAFQTVYDNAVANSLMLRAICLLGQEDSRGMKKNLLFQQLMQDEYAPLTEYYDDDEEECEDDAQEKVTLQIKRVVDDIKDDIAKLPVADDKCAEAENSNDSMMQTIITKISNNNENLDDVINEHRTFRQITEQQNDRIDDRIDRLAQEMNQNAQEMNQNSEKILSTMQSMAEAHAQQISAYQKLIDTQQMRDSQKTKYVTQLEGTKLKAGSKVKRRNIREESSEDGSPDTYGSRSIEEYWTRRDSDDDNDRRKGRRKCENGNKERGRRASDDYYEERRARSNAKENAYRNRQDREDEYLEKKDRQIVEVDKRDARITLTRRDFSSSQQRLAEEQAREERSNLLQSPQASVVADQVLHLPAQPPLYSDAVDARLPPLRFKEGRLEIGPSSVEGGSQVAKSDSIKT